MELIELVSNELFRLPIKRETASIVRIIGNKFSVYIDLLKKLHNKGYELYELIFPDKYNDVDEFYRDNDLDFVKKELQKRELDNL